MSNQINYAYLEYVMVNYIHYDRDAFYDMTFGEILDVISIHHKEMDKQNKKLNQGNKQQNDSTTKGEKETYGRVDNEGNLMSLDEIMGE